MVDGEEPVVNSKTVPTIRDLIRDALAAGRTVRDLERDSGYMVKFQTFQELSARVPKEFPKKTRTITGLARALDVSETAIVLGYAQALGVAVNEVNNTFALRLPRDVATIEPEMQNAIINMARAAVKRRRPGLRGDADDL